MLKNSHIKNSKEGCRIKPFGEMKDILTRLSLIVLVLATTVRLFAQGMQSIELQTSQGLYAGTQNAKAWSIQFPYQLADETVIVRICFSTQVPDSLKVERVKLVHSGEFEVVDSLIEISNDCYQTKIRFKNLHRSQLLQLGLRLFTPSNKKPTSELINLLPHTITTCSLESEMGDFFIGEEKTIALFSNHINNIRTESEWRKMKNYDYRVVEEQGQLFLRVMPNQLGKITLEPILKTFQPVWKSDSFNYALKCPAREVWVKEGRVNFLSFNQREFTYDEKSRSEGIEVQFDHHRSVQIQKTYRIENQEKPGGYLVGELFTQSSLSNEKVLSTLRLYNLHNQSDGYLYIKDGDHLKFITNFSVTPSTQVKSLSVLHEGGDWTNNVSIYPGETVLVKIQGDGLNKANFVFKDVYYTEKDTLIKDESTKIFTVQVPITINVRNIELYNHSKNTGFKLRVQEYREPRSFDFVTINYGDGDMKASHLDKPVMHDEVIRDVVISFNPNAIDTDKKLYGEQYFTIRFKITSVDNRLIDQQEIRNVLICPSSRSPRFAFYDQSRATYTQFNLNNFLRTKTYDLQDWSRIEIELEHDSEQYGKKGYKQRIEIIYQRHYDFDIDVSFPAGLLIHKQGDGFGNFGGISMAMMAQFSFFHPQKIARYRPYKIGAGFLALNAFNYSNNANISRDVGIVVIGSVFPMGSRGKLTFPLYLGGGYFITQGKWFTLLGPGIRISF